MKKKYILITSAYNEEKYMENTIKSVLAQTILPHEWIIISDGSNDGTDEIIKKYSKQHTFIKYLRRSDKEKSEHDFGSKVHALNKAIESIKSLEYNYLGILDADIVLDPDFYEKLIDIMESVSKYGIIGGGIYENINGNVKFHDVSLNIVCGAVQFFRKECFVQIGRFLPMIYGGEDSMMCVEANFNNWETRTFPEIKALEQGFVGRSQGSAMKARYNRGKSFFDMGYHPLFMLMKCIYRIKDRPFLFGSLAEFSGFFSCAIKNEERNAPEQLVRFLRESQILRIKNKQMYR